MLDKDISQWGKNISIREASFVAMGIPLEELGKDINDGVGADYERACDALELIGREKITKFDELCDLLRADLLSIRPTLIIDTQPAMLILDLATPAEINRTVKLTKRSVAEWFIAKGETAIAESIFPDETRNKEPSPKTVNAYLKIISALSDALIDGLTGIINTDASAVLAALDKKGVERPVEERTLAKYLGEAKKL